MNSQGKLLMLFAEWINKEGFEPLHLRGGKNLWRRGEHCDYTNDFETKDNEDLVNEFLNQLSKLAELERRISLPKECSGSNLCGVDGTCFSQISGKGFCNYKNE